MAPQRKNLVIGLLCCVLSLGSPAVSQSTISRNVNDLKFFYFPSADQKIEIAFNDTNSLFASNLQAGVKTVLIIDGFLSNSTTPMSVNVKDSYISHGNQNVIVVDWGRLSGSGLTLGNPVLTAAAYLTVLSNVGPVGQRIADFLNFVSVNKQVQLTDVTIIGHSLGAHVAGVAGANVRDNYNQLLNRIAGLDPAGPVLYLQLSPNQRIHSGQASFVDIYHTNMGTLGDSTPGTGDVDIYVNGGSSQPGCAQADLTGYVGYCSHSYSWKLFDSAFDTSVTGCPCSVDCTCTTCQHQCDNPIVVGPYIDPSVRGSLYVTSGPLP